VSRYAAAHKVGQYASLCRGIVAENATKVDVEWEFKTRPRDWTFINRDPMKVLVSRDRGVQFSGNVYYGGKDLDHTTRFQYCAIGYDKDRSLTGNKFFEVRIEGEIPEGTGVDLGMGIVGPGRTRKLGRSGIQLKRNARSNKIAIRLEGGETEQFKRDKARNYLEFSDVDWPAGKFVVEIRVEDREKGLASIWLNGKNVLASKLKDPAGQPRGNERCTIFGRGRGNRGISIFAWIEGVDGTDFKDIYISKVTLVRAGQ